MFGVAASNNRVLEDAAELIVPTADGKMLNYSWPTDGGAVCFFLYTASRICCHVLDHHGLPCCGSSYYLALNITAKDIAAYFQAVPTCAGGGQEHSGRRSKRGWVHGGSSSGPPHLTRYNLQAKQRSCPLGCSEGRCAPSFCQPNPLLYKEFMHA